VAADLGATYPALLGIAIATLVFGVIFLSIAVLLIVGATRRAKKA
jgi:hypothetical protein